jgi:hypothetical protein
MIKILYGVAPHHLKDITLLAIRQHVRDNIIMIPRGDENRAYLFSDPIPGVVKMILFIDDSGSETVIGPNDPVYIDLATQKVYTTDVPEHIKHIYPD